MKKMSTKKCFTWAQKKIREFFKATPLVIMGTGTSCAVDSRFGMDALKNALLSRMASEPLDKESKRQWRKVTKALVNTDVEHALDFAKTDQLRKVILSETGASIAALDQKYAASIYQREIAWPAMEIIEKIVAGLSVSDNYSLCVITTNYDLLFEYACAAHGIVCIDGFCGNVIKNEDWNSARRMVRHSIPVVRNKRKREKDETESHVELHKVHGSLNRFFVNNAVVSADMWIANAPHDIERVIITPGASKYEKIQNYRKELQLEADKAVDSARGFLFLGYGMNDAHIERYIVQNIQTERKPALFITRDLNDRIKNLAQKNDGVWIVCGLERPDDGSRIFNNQLGGWLTVPTKKLWDFSQFAKKIL